MAGRVNLNSLLTVGGEERPLREWAEEYNLRAEVLLQRLRSRWDLEEALSTPEHRSDVDYPVTFNGETRTLGAWAKHLKIDYSTLRYRILVAGWDIKEALTVEPRGRTCGPRAAEHRIWVGLIKRCHDPFSLAYPSWGAIGFTVCKRWRESFRDFYTDVGPRPMPSRTVSILAPEVVEIGPTTAGWIGHDRVKKLIGTIRRDIGEDGMAEALLLTEEHRAKALAGTPFTLEKERQPAKRGPDRRPRTMPPWKPTGRAIMCLLVLGSVPPGTTMTATEVGSKFPGIPPGASPSSYVATSLATLEKKGLASGHFKRPRRFMLTEEGVTEVARVKAEVPRPGPVRDALVEYGLLSDGPDFAVTEHGEEFF